MDSDLFITTDTKRSDGVSCFAYRSVSLNRQSVNYGLRTVDRCLARQLLEHFGGTSQTIAGLSDTDIEDEFLDFLWQC